MFLTVPSVTGSQWVLWPFLTVTLFISILLLSWLPSDASTPATLSYVSRHHSFLSNHTPLTAHLVATRSQRRTSAIRGASLTTNQFVGTVVRVLDGDTIEVLHEGRGERVRLANIDCPEKSQAFGNRAKQFTSELAFGREVTVQIIGSDRNKRTIGEVRLLDGTSLNRELVHAGFAWWYRAYSHDQSLEDLEREAIAAKRGLWEDPHSIPPWEFRKSKKSPPAVGDVNN